MKPVPGFKNPNFVTGLKYTDRGPLYTDRYCSVDLQSSHISEATVLPSEVSFDTPVVCCVF